MKKTGKLAVVIASIALTLAMLTLFGCKPSHKPEDVERIELNTEQCQKEFYVDDTFSADGIVITAFFTDGTSEAIALADCKITKPNMNVDGTKTIVVKYGDKTASYQITVIERPLEWSADFTVDSVNGDMQYDLAATDALLSNGVSANEGYVSGFADSRTVIYMIDVKAAGAADVYIDYDHTLELSLTDKHKIADLFSIEHNGTAVELNDVIFNKCDGESHVQHYCFQKTLVARINFVEGQNTLRVRALGSASAVSNFKGIYVDYKIVDSLKLNTDAVNKSYETDDSFDKTGLVVTAVYLNGREEAIALENCDVSVPDMTESGEKQVTVSYGEKSATFNITVSARNAAVVDIELDTTEAVKTFKTDEAFSATGLVVKAVLEEGNPINIALENVTITEPDMTTPGTKQVTVSYRTFEKTYEITVNTPFTVSRNENSVSFIARDALKIGTLTASDSGEGAVGNINAGDKLIYKITAEQDVTVKLFFWYGGQSRPVSQVMTFTVNNGTESTVIESSNNLAQVGWTPVQQQPVAEITLKQGYNTITVDFLNSFGGNFLSINFDFDVLQSLSVDATNVKKDFLTEEEFVYDGLVVTATYARTGTVTLDDTQYVVETPDMSTAGEKTVTVTFDGKSGEYTINVEQNEAVLTEITLNTDSVTTVYSGLEEFSAAGLVVTGHYSDGSELAIGADRYAIDYPKYMATLGTHTVTVSYGGRTATYDITVESDKVFNIAPDDTNKSFELNSTQSLYSQGIYSDAGYENISVGHIDASKDPKIIFYVNSETAGEADLLFWYSNNFGGQSASANFDVYVNGERISVDGIILATGGSGWQSFDNPTNLGKINLVEGNNTIEFRFKANGTNFKGITLDFDAE